MKRLFDLKKKTVQIEALLKITFIKWCLIKRSISADNK